MYEKIIFGRIHQRLEKKFTENQFGARKGKNTADALFIVRTISTYYKYISHELLLEFLDLVKAFDTMDLRS